MVTDGHIDFGVEVAPTAPSGAMALIGRIQSSVDALGQVIQSSLKADASRLFLWSPIAIGAGAGFFWIEI